MKLINSTLLHTKVFQNNKQIIPIKKHSTVCEYNIDESLPIDIKLSLLGPKYSVKAKNSDIINFSMKKSVQIFLYLFMLYALCTCILEANNALSDLSSTIFLILGCILLAIYFILYFTKKIYTIEVI